MGMVVKYEDMIRNSSDSDWLPGYHKIKMFFTTRKYYYRKY